LGYVSLLSALKVFMLTYGTIILVSNNNNNNNNNELYGFARGFPDAQDMHTV